nr:hypothetical protein [uncultured Acidocella sp.]
MALQTSSAHARVRERLFVMWEEAGSDPDAAYQLWHKVRPLLEDRGISSAARPATRRQAPAREEKRR